MTRRKFIQKLIKAGSAIIVGVCWVAPLEVGRLSRLPHQWWGLLTGLAKRDPALREPKAAPRKFVRAVRLKKYPGPLRALRDISGSATGKQSKWSG